MSSKNTRWLILVAGISILTCFIGLLVIRALMLGIYQIDIFTTDNVSVGICYIIVLPTGLGMVWIVYRQSLIGITYTSEQHHALLQQTWGMAVCVFAVFAFLISFHPAFVIVSSLSIGYIGINTIRNRVALVFHHPLFFRPYNTGVGAIVVGLLEIAGAIYLLFVAVRALL